MSRAAMQQALDAFEAGTYAAESAAITALKKALTAPQPAQQEQEPVAIADGKWYLVRYEGLSKTHEAPALYRENAKAFYSVEFSGIPTRQVVVLGAIDCKAMLAPPAQPAQPEQDANDDLTIAYLAGVHAGKKERAADKDRDALETALNAAIAEFGPERVARMLTAQPAQRDGTAEHPYNFASYQAGFAEAQAQPAKTLAEGQIEADFEAWLNSDDRKKEAQGKEYPITYLGMDQMARDCMPTPGRPRSELRPSHDNPDPTKTVWHSGCC